MEIDTFFRMGPLYRLADVYEDKDTEILLGIDVSSDLSSRYNMSPLLERIYDIGARRIFSETP